jgi:hypothetical protein
LNFTALPSSQVEEVHQGIRIKKRCGADFRRSKNYCVILLLLEVFDLSKKKIK